MIELVKQFAEDGWVWGEGGLPVGNPVTLAADVTQLYERDYIAAWDAILNDLELVPFSTVPQTADALGILAGPTSPLRGLLRAVVDNTSLVDSPDTAPPSGALVIGRKEGHRRARETPEAGAGGPGPIRRGARQPGDGSLPGDSPASGRGTRQRAHRRRSDRDRRDSAAAQSARSGGGSERSARGIVEPRPSRHSAGAAAGRGDAAAVGRRLDRRDRRKDRAAASIAGATSDLQSRYRTAGADTSASPLSPAATRSARAAPTTCRSPTSAGCSVTAGDSTRSSTTTWRSWWIPPRRRGRGVLAR